MYQIGSISAKMSVSFAQRFNSDPYYLIGESDKNGGYSKEAIEHFLKDKGILKVASREREVRTSPSQVA